jgi:hypothetical protein
MVLSYTQVLRQPDLIWHDRNEVAHLIILNEAVARVFRRLANRLQGVVADTSMLTILPEYAAHFLEVYVKKTEMHSFHTFKFWMEMQPQLFHTSTAADRRTLFECCCAQCADGAGPNSRRGSVFTRSTPGCGILDGPSLEWAASQWQNLIRSAGCLCLWLPNECGQLRGLAVTFSWYIHSIYLVYTWYMHGISCLTLNHAF